MLPSDHERQQNFFRLQKLGSIIAWQRVDGFYGEWLAAAGNRVREIQVLESDLQISVRLQTGEKLQLRQDRIARSLLLKERR